MIIIELERIWKKAVVARLEVSVLSVKFPGGAKENTKAVQSIFELVTHRICQKHNSFNQLAPLLVNEKNKYLQNKLHSKTPTPFLLWS
jgi:hypothetical protein